jgi:hypothetical protein
MRELQKGMESLMWEMGVSSPGAEGTMDKNKEKSEMENEQQRAFRVA